MYSNFPRQATCAAALIFAACATLPWSSEPIGEEVNIAFVMKNNLPAVSSMTINGRPGTFLVGSSTPRTILDNRFARSLDTKTYTLQIEQRESLHLAPLFADLHGIADGIIGSAVWGDHAVTFDYHAGLITYQREGIHPDLMHVYHYEGNEPMITIVVDGHTIPAIVDTTSPDTVVLRRLDAPAGSRRKAEVQVAGTDFGTIDVGLGDVSAARLGNRVLSKFLITIDYGKHVVGLWRDPRTPM